MDRVEVGVLAGLVALLAATCGGVGWVLIEDAQDPDSGTIISKQYSPATSTMVCSPVGKTTICNAIPIPECWQLTFHDGDDSGDVCVDPVTWERIEVGSEWP